MSMEDHEEAQRRFEEVYRFMKNNYGWDSDDWRKFHDFLPDEFGNRRNSLDYNELKQAAIDFHDG